MTTLGTKLLNLRKEHKLSQTELAEKLAVSQTAYSKWEADKYKPGTNNLQKLSIFYQVDMAKLLDDNEKNILSHYKIKEEKSITANTVPTLNIPQPGEPMEKVLQNQEQILHLLERQYQLIKNIPMKA